MPNLLEIKNAINAEGVSSLSRKIILLGKPKSGKSILAATISKVPSIKRVFYFDLENSIESVISGHAPEHLQLTDEELAKITYIPVPDTHERPLAAETILKCFTALPSKPANLCTVHGKVDCKEKTCLSDRIPFSLASATAEDAIIIDSGSQLADSILALEMLTQSYKDLRKYYGAFTIEASAILAGIQAAKCSIVFVTHLLDIESKPSDPGALPQLIETVPLFGSKNYSKNKISKYFGWSIMTEVRNGKYLVGSSPTFKSKVDLGNRAGIAIENYEGFNLSWIYKPLEDWPQPSTAAGPSVKIKT